MSMSAMPWMRSGISESSVCFHVRRGFSNSTENVTQIRVKRRIRYILVLLVVLVLFFADYPIDSTYLLAQVSCYDDESNFEEIESKTINKIEDGSIDH